MMKVLRKLTVFCLLLFAFAGSLVAQNDDQFVIKKTKYNDPTGDDHYLAHVLVDGNYVLQDATEFSPNCLWYSGREYNLMGSHHNYYFLDETGEPRFLMAPLASGGDLSISLSKPPVYLLNNTDQDYYFYDWDYDNRPEGAGVARGHQYNGVANSDQCELCEGGKWDEGDSECWAVYWVEYNVIDNVAKWRLSTVSQYNITENSGRFRLVTVEQFPMQVNGEGGLSDLNDFVMEFDNPGTHPLSATITEFQYIPAYKKYDFDDVTVPYDENTNPNGPTLQHYTYYYPGGSSAPTEPIQSGTGWTYNWSIAGAGAEYLSFSETGDYTHTSTSATPTLYYRTENTTGHKTATLTLTVTYQDGSTQTTTATVTVLTPCQNPQFSASVNYEGVIISWTPTAENYTVSWKKSDASDWSSHGVGNVTSYTIPTSELEYSTTYDYKVKATCEDEDPTSQQFTTLKQPSALIGGAVYGGGRMADVTGKTDVVIINTDSIGAVYGGNDIAGEVVNAAGSTIKLGVLGSDPDAVEFNNSQASTKVRVGDVYGGGNGYYAYDGATFVPADNEHTSFVVPNNGTVNMMTQSHTVGEVVWENTTGAAYTLVVPKIVKTAITVANDAVKVDSIFGGAKNAFITNPTTTANGTSITVNGGTAFAVFGGNNYGGNQTAGIHHIEVTSTKINTSPDVYPDGLGRNYGIGYVFGGGNKVHGLKTDVTISGGMCDTVFAGGNAADVGDANVVINCPSNKFYSNAITGWDSNDHIIGINPDYAWNGTGIYNVRTLFGGNNRASMQGLPTLTLTSGSIGTVYGGGNAGDMLAMVPDDEDPNTNPGTGYIATNFDPPMVGDEKIPIYYSTHVVTESDKIIVDYLYGGCQMSDVLYSTWTEIKGGHLGVVYGGCNISGDVGSLPRIPYDECDTDEKYQLVNGGTYVEASGGTIYSSLVAGSNGYYHCNNGIEYIDGVINLGNYVGDTIPTHNETHVLVSGDVIVKGDVYAGGNLAYVGFINETDQGYKYRDFVGFCSVRMTGGTVEGSVYGGGNRASIFGSNEVRVSGGSIGYVGNEPVGGALYGGNDHSGQVAQITNRVLPSSFGIASDGETDLRLLGVKTYVGITNKPRVNTVYGGGNGAYEYLPEEYCDITDQPVQSNTFVDVNIDADCTQGPGGYINEVYGGGNGVTVLDRITVFVNNENVDLTSSNTYDQVGTIYGGNNLGDLDILSDIILLNGQVNTIYGGCNRGAMTGSLPYNGYPNLGSMVHLRKEYRPNGTGEAVLTNGKVTGAVYGGCRMNGVDHNTLVLVEAGEHPASFFGGCDISGAVGDTSHVVVVGGNVNGNIYGGGNGNYYYAGNKVYDIDDHDHLIDSIASGNVIAPTCLISRVDILGGQIGTGTGTNQTADVFGGGFGEPTSTIGNVFVNVGPAIATDWEGLPLIYGDIYGGSAFGNVNTSAANATTVNFLNGTLHGNIYGGGLGDKADLGTGHSNIEAKVFGKVFVNISTADQLPENCFIDLRNGNVYGCNNTNGSPQDDVTVHVWKTAFVFPDDDNDYTAATGSHPYYAIDQVFGGGNQADYAPKTEGEVNLDKKILVYVHDCLNTIRRVFSGGNAAAASRVSAIIDGGRMDYVFGGGNGEVDPANIGLGGTDLEIRGGIINYLFGGSNTSGDIAGPMYTEVNNDSHCTEDITEFYGGCNLAQITTGNTIRSVIKCGTGKIHEAYGGSKLADIVGDVILEVRGGTIDEVYGGSKGDLQSLGTGHINESADIDGKVTLNLEGGIITDAFGGSNINGVITDSITVNVIDFGGTCGLDLTNVYGGGNVTPYAPTETSFGPVVNVMHIGQEAGIRGKVFGGGKGATALVTANPVVNFGYNATTMQVYLDAIADKPTTLDPADFIAYVSGIDQEGVVHADWGNVFGGGDLAPVSGNTTINYYQGEVTHKVVGGGNQADINGNTMVYVMGGTIGTDGNATTGAGKGVYGGCNTSGNVSGNVLVQLTGGTVGVSSENTANIHGGGYGNATTVAGNVTVNFGDNTNVANENIMLYGDLYGGSALGSVNTDASNITTVNLRNGVIHGGAYGGGLGDADHDGWGWVKGKVLVNVGNATDPTDPNTYTGQANLVDCDVYGCNNLNGSPQDEVQVHVYQTTHFGDNFVDYTDGSYAIHQVFGGGNRADYTVGFNKANVYIHGCENTIYRVFGGGNAAAVYGVDITIDGGRFDEMFGGGNGEGGPQYAANVGMGGIAIVIKGGYFNLVFNGSNQHGVINGPITYTTEEGPCGDMTILDHFLGSNQVTIFGDVTATINCNPDNPMTFVNLYCGSNRAQIYGNINVTIKGGVFENVYGGSKGRLDEPAYSSDINIINEEDIAQYPDEHLVLGEGGNITLTINGGTIGNLFGACDLNGNVEGKVSITVDNIQNECGLFIGNIYGGGHITDYTPNDPDIRSPKIMVLNATVGGPTSDLPIIGNTGNDTIYEGNVFGGGYYGHVTSNPEVIIGNGTDQSLVNIEGNVYGGGKQGRVNGNADVVIVPHTHQFTYSQPATGGVIRVIDSKGNLVPAGTTLTFGEHLDLKIEAIPSVYGYGFDEWTVTGTGASVTNPNSVSTVFTMGTENASVATTFMTKPTHTLSVTQPAHGSISVKDGLGVDVNLNRGISEGAVLYLEATPAEGYKFVGWAVTQGDGYMTQPASDVTTFIMGTQNTTITAIIEEVQP